MSRPELSVVIPSVNGLGDLIGCLEAMKSVGDSVRLEVIVVDRLGGDVATTVRERFPWAVLVPVPRDTTIPAMRHIAFQQAAGEVVAVIEDHIIVPPGWGRQLLNALARGSDVVGGPIANAATGRLLDWSTFLCEYSACLPPLPAGASAWLPGNNIAYRREVLDQFRDVTAEGRWENRLHDAMKAAGITLMCDPTIVVGHKKHFGFGEYISQRYLYSRSYAGARMAGASVARRVATGAAAFALPPLLLVRTVRSILRKGVSPRLVAATLPLIAIYVTSWGFGEIVGYWFGAGNALARVR